MEPGMIVGKRSKFAIGDVVRIKKHSPTTPTFEMLILDYLTNNFIIVGYCYNGKIVEQIVSPMSLVLIKQGN